MMNNEKLIEMMKELNRMVNNSNYEEEMKCDHESNGIFYIHKDNLNSWFEDFTFTEIVEIIENSEFTINDKSKYFEFDNGSLYNLTEFDIAKRYIEYCLETVFNNIEDEEL